MTGDPWRVRGWVRVAFLAFALLGPRVVWGQDEIDSLLTERGDPGERDVVATGAWVGRRVCGWAAIENAPPVPACLGLDAQGYTLKGRDGLGMSALWKSTLGMGDAGWGDIEIRPQVGRIGTGMRGGVFFLETPNVVFEADDTLALDALEPLALGRGVMAVDLGMHGRIEFEENVPVRLTANVARLEAFTGKVRCLCLMTPDVRRRVPRGVVGVYVPRTRPRGAGEPGEKEWRGWRPWRGRVFLDLAEVVHLSGPGDSVLLDNPIVRGVVYHELMHRWQDGHRATSARLIEERHLYPGPMEGLYARRNASEAQAQEMAWAWMWLERRGTMTGVEARELLDHYAVLDPGVRLYVGYEERWLERHQGGVAGGAEQDD